MFFRLVLPLLVMAYGIALFIYLDEALGWFGHATHPIAAIYLYVLGLPWNAIPSSADFLVVFLVFSPLINFALIWYICRVLKV